jgi:hypothetical protein
MRILSLFSRALKQELRDPFLVALTLFTTPFFIFFYWLVLGHSNPKIIGIYFPDSQFKNTYPQINQEIESRLKQSGKENPTSFQLISFSTEEDFLIHQKKNPKMILITLSKNSFLENPHNSSIEIQFDSSNEKDRLIALRIKSILSDILLEPLQIIIEGKEEQASKTIFISDFDAFVPGFLVFSIIMIIFSTSMAFTSEIESGVLMRYRLSNTSSIEYLLGLGSLQYVNSVFAIAISIFVTYLLGFNFQGKILEVFILCSLGSLSAVGIGILIASLSNKMNLAFLTSSFVMFLLLLFSGIIFPKPEIYLKINPSTSVEILAILPTAQLKEALDHLLIQNRPLSKSLNNMSFLLVSSVLFLSLGAFFFRKLLIKGGKDL